MKILIIGGGPAGATAAKLLAKKYDVTLIQDRDWDKPCGGGTKIKLFDEMDIPKNLIKHKLNYIYMNYKNTKIKIDLKGENLAIVKRAEFDKTLRELAVKQGVKLYYGKFKRFKEKKAVIEIKKEKILFNFDILIAADGVNSSVRRALNLPPIPKTITHYAKIDKEIETCEFYFDEALGGKYYAWEFPHINKTHIGSVDKTSFNNFCKFLNIEVKPKGYFIPTWQENITIQKNNIYFVGDAASQVMPMSFEGIYYAIHSAKILADSIINQKDYKKEWNKRFLKEFKFMKFIEKIHQTKLKGLMIKLHKFEYMRTFSVNLWLHNYEC
ncbi:FAD-dependent monooxygenase [Lebetimonas sp. JS032]|uniref:FAD-dependent monooxygenase n=1 Tax=Lebetimonas sp. JS032 TaxID=990070 RepID=UPI000465494F|nr:NAD(P)/FAD-dependent oxidoreductase [Lebetimonas sp. JS032]